MLNRALLAIAITLLAVSSSGTWAEAHVPSASIAVVAKQDEDRLAAAEQFAVDLSVLESSGDWYGMAAALHPDAAVITPAEAVSGWFSQVYAAKRAAPIVVTESAEESWLWPVNGRTYDSVAVTYTQEIFDGSGSTETTGVIHVVDGPNGWGWFFGADRAFLEEQIAAFAPEFEPTGIGGLIPPDAAWQADRAARFPDHLHAHVDAFWATRFAELGWTYRSPAATIGFREVTQTPCGEVDPAQETAFYCVIDETIYFSDPFRELVMADVGDFGWVVIVAHEWGHHVQHILGEDFAPSAFRSGHAAPQAIEQQADCLAGAYVDGAELSGWLDPGDVDEATMMTGLAGDPEPRDGTDPLAHGSREERVSAFLSGYHDGMRACDIGE